jgi:hypothetical protein
MLTVVAHCRFRIANQSLALPTAVLTRWHADQSHFNFRRKQIHSHPQCHVLAPEAVCACLCAAAGYEVTDDLFRKSPLFLESQTFHDECC